MQSLTNQTPSSSHSMFSLENIFDADIFINRNVLKVFLKNKQYIFVCVTVRVQVVVMMMMMIKNLIFMNGYIDNDMRNNCV